jgi:microcompartment protein CcmK/EutM
VFPAIGLRPPLERPLRIVASVAGMSAVTVACDVAGAPLGALVAVAVGSYAALLLLTRATSKTELLAIIGRSPAAR